VIFSFKADVDGLVLTLTAERIYRSKQAERFILRIVGTDYKLVVQTNRPAVEAAKSGKTIQWHVVEGNADDKARLESVYKQLEKALQQPPSSFQATLNFIDHF
jgi:hypothetical protein